MLVLTVIWLICLGIWDLEAEKQHALTLVWLIFPLGMTIILWPQLDTHLPFLFRKAASLFSPSIRNRLDLSLVIVVTIVLMSELIYQFNFDIYIADEQAMLYAIGILNE